MKWKQATLLCCGWIVPLWGWAALLTGKVTDENGQPLPYASVYLKNTTTGTTTNVEGSYSLELPPGNAEIVFQYVGYRRQVKQVYLGEQSMRLDVVMQKESVELKEVVVASGAEDPANEIIRQAQARRKYYLGQVKAYTCNVYIKGMQAIDQIPEKIFGISLEKQGIDSSLLGIVYLSESESKYHYSEPDKVKEIVYSSKVSGDNNAFSWNSAEAFSSDFYENIIPLGGIMPRGLVSPIAEGAFTFYRYQLLGTFYEEDLLINKIRVMARRASDPVFNGTLYIVENSWNIHSLDLMVTKDAHLDFVDSLRFQETFARINDTAWMPRNQLLEFQFKAFGFSGKGYFLGVFSNYNLIPDFSGDFFDAERLRVNEDANLKDSLYWKENRPVPLTVEEQIDYTRKDSMHALHTSRPYLDSVDHENNRFKPQDILFGYRHQNSYEKWSYSFRNPLLGISYNTVEGLNLTLRTRVDRETGPETGWHLNADLRYGFSNNRAGARVLFEMDDDPIHFQQWKAGAGIFPAQVNENKPISELVNAAYTLVATENFMKIYEKRFVAFTHEREWFNGFTLTSAISYSDRLPLENTADYSFGWMEGNTFTPNNYFGNARADTLERSQALVVGLRAQIHIGQKYMSRPDRRIITGSKFPALLLEYKKGIRAFGTDPEFSDVNFDLLEVGSGYTLDLGLVGKSLLKVSAGFFISNTDLTIIDFRHFQGNQTIFGSHYANGFQLLPYYSYSTDQSWMEMHYEHHFGGFLFNKIPLVKKLNLQEVAGGHFLVTPGITYFEFAAGIEHLFKFIRIDFVASFNDQGKPDTGFLVGLSFGSGALEVE